jgi:hypothetical protein
MTAAITIPDCLTAKRVTSQRRAAAARANGAKSRGPVTAHGKANSSRNSRRHGLRSPAPLFTDTASQAGLAANIAAFQRDFEPQSPHERELINMIAVANWRQTCLFRLEIDMFKREALPLGSLFALSRLDARYERQYETAYKALTEHRAFLRRKVKAHERTQQVTETTTRAHTAATPEPTGSAPVDHIPERAHRASPLCAISVKAHERTRQTAENTNPHPVPNPEAVPPRNSTFAGSYQPGAKKCMCLINPADTSYQTQAH